jgi:pimeloyl-ACP methyl ester carboxylesterase
MPQRHIEHVCTPYGDIAYERVGAGPPALFVHGVFLNGHLWRDVIAGVADLRSCIAIDLLGHGETRTPGDADMSFDGQAAMLEAVCTALDLGQVDIVANDSGGGIAQIFAAKNPARIRSLTLTNCDVHDNWPPPALEPLLAVARGGKLGELGRAMLADIDFARQSLAVGYEHPERLSAETVRIYLEPLFRTPEAADLVAKMFIRMDNRQTTAIEPGLRALAAPTLIVWGDGDTFFDVKWARWLAQTLPGALEPIILEGAKLFFPGERPGDLIAPLRRFWSPA